MKQDANKSLFNKIIGTQKQHEKEREKQGSGEGNLITDADLERKAGPNLLFSIRTIDSYPICQLFTEANGQLFHTFNS